MQRIIKANSNYSYIKKSLSKYWNSKLPELVIIENLNDIPEDLKLNPNLGVYLDVSIESFNEVLLNLLISCMRITLIYFIQRKTK